MTPNPENDVKLLRKENAKLKQELEATKAVLELLRELPGNRVRTAVSQARRKKEEVVTESPAATPMSDPSPSEPAPAATKTPAKAPRGRPKADRGSASEGTNPSP